MQVTRLIVLTIFAVGLGLAAMFGAQMPSEAKRKKRLTREQKARARTIISKRTRKGKPRLRRRHRKSRSVTIAEVEATFVPNVAKLASADYPEGQTPMKMVFRPVALPNGQMPRYSYPNPGSQASVTIQGITFSSGDDGNGGPSPDPDVVWSTTTRIISGGVTLANDGSSFGTLYNAYVEIRNITFSGPDITAVTPTGYRPVFRNNEGGGLGQYVFGHIPATSTQVPGTDKDGDQRGCVWFFEVTTSDDSTAETFTFLASLQAQLVAPTEGFVPRTLITPGRFGSGSGFDGDDLVVLQGDSTFDGSAFTTDIFSYDRTGNAWSGAVVASSARRAPYSVNGLDGILYFSNGADTTGGPWATATEGFSGGATVLGVAAPDTVWDFAGDSFCEEGTGAMAGDGLCYLFYGINSAGTRNDDSLSFRQTSVAAGDIAPILAGYTNAGGGRDGVRAVTDVMGRIFLIGGEDAGGPDTEVVEIDPLAIGLSRLVAILPSATTRGQASLGADGRIYYFGGNSDAAHSVLEDEVYQFTVPSGAGPGGWSDRKAAAGSALGLARGIAQLMNDGRIHVYGGFNGFSETHTAYSSP